MTTAQAPMRGTRKAATPEEWAAAGTAAAAAAAHGASRMAGEKAGQAEAEAETETPGRRSVTGYEGKVPVFPNGDPYIRLTLSSLQADARDSFFPRAARVKFAAQGWANKSGHAGFSPGALAKILGKDGVPTTPQVVSNAIRAAKARGTISPESRAHCLVVNHDQASQGFGRQGCPVHGLGHP